MPILPARPARVVAWLAACWPIAAHANAPQPAERVDVVVYAATPAGIQAACAVARAGRSVRLVEPGRFLGGMMTGGLGATDAGNRGAIGGASRDFFRRVRAHYEATFGPAAPQVKDCSDGFLFEPHVADLVFRQLLDEAKVEVVRDEPIVGVDVDHGRVESIRTRSRSFAAAVFVDASYEGDLMALAKVPHATGREAAATYGESLAGVLAQSPAHQWSVPVAGRGTDGRPLPLVGADAPGAAGSGDDRTQAYNYRLCLTDRPANRVPFPRPDGYDPARYELLARYLAARPDVKLGQLMNPVRLPNGKTDTNNNGPISTDHIGANWAYPAADADARRAIAADHVAYTRGFLYFLANDPRVPPGLAAEVARWGLAKDEFVANDHWPHQLYVREARRLRGAVVMTQADIMADRDKPDAVALGSYNADSHHVQRTIQPDGSVRNEGDFQVKVRPYAIPYRSLTPRREDATNLLVPVCLSASHVAYGTIRMEPVYMILGEAAGTAAALAAAGQLAVQDVPVDRLQALLRERGAVLHPAEVPGAAGGPAALAPARLEGITVDDEQAELAGDWQGSTAVGPFVGAGYHHDGGARDGRASARFVPDLPRAGRYEVRLFAPPSSNRATNAPAVVRAADGEHAVAVDQRRADRGGSVPIVLGTFSFDAGRAGSVTVGNAGADGHVVVDAVQFVPRP